MNYILAELNKAFIEMQKKAPRKERLDECIKTEFQISRSQAKRLIQNGQIEINGKLVKKAGHIVEAADLIKKLNLNENKESSKFKIPKKIPLKKLQCIYQDEELFVINKDPGISVHPAPNSKNQITIVDLAKEQIPELKKWKGDPERPGLIHRLDKDTSGVLLLAKTVEAHQKWSKRFHDRELEKEYLTLVWGQPQSTEGKILAPMARSKQYRTQMGIHPQGKSAHTEFKILDTSGEMSLLKIKIKTGRTHQIRVHLASIGFPIVGDPVYGDLKKNLWAKEEGLTRIFLHAWKLSCGKVRFEAEVPEDLISFLQNPKAKLGLGDIAS